jgi:cytochrome c554/c'-like protein
VEEPSPEKRPKDMPGDDAIDQPIETSARVADVSRRYMADYSTNHTTPPGGQPQAEVAVSRAESEVTLAAEGETAAAPGVVPPSPVAEIESRHPLREPGAGRRLASNPLRPNTSASTDTAELKSPAASETRSDHVEQGHASSPIGKKGELFDPIKVNGQIFVGWPKPRLALLISGRQDGYLEPCGCAGLDRMKGGLSRRHSLVRELRQKRGWEVVGLDVGGMVKGYGRQAELKFQITVNAFRQMGYGAIGLGKSDLKNRATELLSVVAGEESPFHSANVGVFGFDAGFTNTSKIVDAGGLKLGITSVLGTLWQQQVNSSDIELADPEAKLALILPDLKNCDLLILLAHATMAESEALAKKFPDFDIVVTAGGPSEPPAQVAKIDDTLLVEVGTKGMNAIVLGLFDDPETPYRYQRVPLDSRFADSADMRDLMAQYQLQLRNDGFAGLGIRKAPHYQGETLGRFVGSKKCESCHEGSYKTWKKTGHAKAFETLVGVPVPRQFDPECISCHVVGWEPNKHFPYESGFWSLEDTPHLKGVGCENCHGPGESHIAAENGGDLALQEKLQKEMTVTVEQARESAAHQCLYCHDLDNSPDFNFEEYWPQIEHRDD